ncbi:PaaI family thioesterase [Rhodopseudomonas pseudopalustris]|uniref:Thioesterase superfamily n=2 Tax=Rhodopseudomonas TaxID=1073 RepID=Q136J5_RHOPS|nr:PaaI family thioesterase [Rhodopseudomonas pseudopalustris]ABE39994.1 thioesterase superfamily [Rhodopseudomonas palustris BisB5]MBB1092483.1 PaaI family thioesterase [Rhodopseudomonas palustris]SEO85783.1 Acyl-coenzyme A thioesterase PaaI, contains HGG motif [Rhodopseudomonas pseudopalustris]
MTTNPPDGFQPFAVADGYIGHNGPYYWRQNADGRPEFGFLSDDRHGNPNGVLHGGAIVAFLDTILGYTVVLAAQRRCATVSLDSRFLATIAPGGWITGRTTMKKISRTLAFIDAEACADDKLLVTTSAVFRIFES